MTPEEAGFLRSFEDCTLPPGEWTHLAHIRMAWLCLGADAFAPALGRIRAGILRYNGEVLDKLSEYHETVTVAYARLIASQMRPGESWEQFSRRNEDLFARSPPALGKFYSMARLMSVEARQAFIEPDLCDLPEPENQGASLP